MKKALSIIFIVISLLLPTAYSEGYTEPQKIGDYFFKLSDEGTMYSINGQSYSLLNEVNAMPVYGNGVYFHCLVEPIPAYYMRGNNNSPLRVYNSELQLVNTIEFEDKENIDGNKEFFHMYYCSDGLTLKFPNNTGDYTYLGFHHATGFAARISPSSYDELFYRTKDGINFERAFPVEPGGFEMVDLPEWIHSDENAVQYSDTEEFELYNGEIFSYNKLNGYTLFREKCPPRRITYLGKYLRESPAYTAVKINNASLLHSSVDDYPFNIESLSMDGFKWLELPRALNLQSGAYADDASIYIKDILSPSKYVKIPFLELMSPQSQIRIIYGDEYFIFEQPPVVENGRTLVPLRFSGEKLGCAVSWNQDTKTAAIKNSDKEISFSIDSNAAVVNGEEKNIDAYARLINSKTMVPLRFICEELGYNITWYEPNNTVVISE